jgi:enoyl-[acyl-carrier protein] reductase I
VKDYPYIFELSFESTVMMHRQLRKCHRNWMRHRFFSDLSGMPPSPKKKLALVMGVANQRSIAWACVESFLQKNFDCIVTYLRPENATKIEQLISRHASHNVPDGPRILGSFPCDVESELPKLFKNDLWTILQGQRTIDAIVHSLAYAPDIKVPLLQTPSRNYLTAQHISAYSLIETIRESMANNLLSDSGAVTTLSYLGAMRAVPGYGAMGPSKAALESIVRGLARELGPMQWRINAVSAGPIKTVSARGIPNFASILEHVKKQAPLRRNVAVEEVAETVTWLSTHATCITGQTIYVDAGYNAVVPIHSGPPPDGVES